MSANDPKRTLAGVAMMVASIRSYLGTATPNRDLDKMRTTKICFAVPILVAWVGISLAVDKNALAEGLRLGVGPQYDTTHVYVAPEDFDRFVESLIAIFGGTKSQAAVINITPTPSGTKWQVWQRANWLSGVRLRCGNRFRQVSSRRYRGSSVSRPNRP